MAGVVAGEVAGEVEVDDPVGLDGEYLSPSGIKDTAAWALCRGVRGRSLEFLSFTAVVDSSREGMLLAFPRETSLPTETSTHPPVELLTDISLGLPSSELFSFETISFKT